MTTGVLKDFIMESKDGEWGKGEADAESTEMQVIRGTDFERVRLGDLSGIPIRHIPTRIAQRKLLQPYDIVIETAGGSKDRPTGRTVLIRPSLIQKAEVPLTCASFSRFIRINPNVADPRYMFWHLQYLYSAGRLRQYHTQHTGVSRFQWTTFAENEVLELPARATQVRVAGLLDAYDDLMENNTRHIAILEEMAQEIFREWFVNFRLPRHEKMEMVESQLGPIPAEWEITAIGKISSYINRGIAPKYDDNADSIAINQRCIRDGRLNLEFARRQSKTIPAEKQARLGDVLVNSTGVGTLGRVTQVCLDIPSCTVDTHVTIIRPSSAVNHDYWGMALMSLETQFEALGFGSTGQTELHRDSIAGVQILLPSRGVQDRFSSVVQPIRNSILNLLSRNEILRQTRDFLLPRVISGEINVAVLENELAGAAT